jgi:transcriptional repressor NrdR
MAGSEAPVVREWRAAERLVSLGRPVLGGRAPCGWPEAAPILPTAAIGAVRRREGAAALADAGGGAVRCPFCRNDDSRVVDSRTAEDGASIRRRRQCPQCGRRFTTVETSSLSVVKRSGATEPFSRDKVVSGVRKACQGRPVSEDDLARLAQQVEESIRSTGAAEVDAHEVGLSILGPLRELDEVAYLRFASVYRSFTSLEDFEAAINALRAEHEGAPTRR